MRTLFLLLLLVVPAWAVEPQVTTGSMAASTGATTVSNSASTYFPISGINYPTNVTDTTGDGPSSLVVSFTLLSSVAPTHSLSNLFCFAGTAPGAAKSYAVAVYEGGIGDTTLTCTISGTNTTCSDTAHTFTTLQHDAISYHVTPSGTPAASTVGCYVEIQQN